VPIIISSRLKSNSNLASNSKKDNKEEEKEEDNRLGNASKVYPSAAN
jgi:hypothetical protein